jgi:intracellular sulfur oxidation DsrE/DsrF family protein
MFRRSFLSRLGIGLTGGAAFGAAGISAQGQSREGGAKFQPARHAADDWFDQVPGQHRFVFDSITADGLTNALLFMNNYYTANQTGYGLTDKDLAVVLVLRHRSTPFAYNNAIWGKYGTPITQRSQYNDPSTNQPPKTNLFAGSGGGGQGGRNTLVTLAERGVQFAVCQISTRNYANTIAMATGANADAVYAELAGNLLANARLVPAGIVAVNRAQERGYSLVYVG